MKIRQKLFFSYVALCAGLVAAHESTELSAVEVRAQAENLQGIAVAASEGLIASQRLQAVPLLRAGEVLESVPGLIVTQHAGDGKANQYFLRGFNLDHGSDFAFSVAGVPVNLPTHAHGQGYSDLNFLIPELVERIRYRKGPYFAEEGDFSSAGVAHIDYFRILPQGLASLTLGGRGYARTLLADSGQAGQGRWLYGLELFHNDGPWQQPENYRRVNGVLRYGQGSRDDGWAVTAMAYQGRWTSTDQIPQRAIELGVLDRFGSLDGSSGGLARRYSLSAEWAQRTAERQMRASLWGLQSSLDLWSNFQYCLNNGCPPGDQFKQAESRQAGGFALSQSHFGEWAGRDVVASLGIQGRVDRLKPVGLYASQSRETLATIREDRVRQHSLAVWGQGEVQWLPWLRSVAGLRADRYQFAVDSSHPDNSGRAGASMLTPRVGLVFGPWHAQELYLNAGHGFHSNDARGATLRTDPVSGQPAEPVSPLVRTRGLELGWRGEVGHGWRSSLALWQLDSASELLFVGDAGTTEAARPSRRRGVEWTNFVALADWLAVDADLAWSHARFRDADPAGRMIPGAPQTTANLGVTVDHLGSWFGALRWRYFGPRPLLEDGSVKARASSLLNLRLGYRLSQATQVAVDVFNLLDQRMNDIEYWYESRLANEPAAVADRHLHPAEPRNLRFSVIYRF